MLLYYLIMERLKLPDIQINKVKKKSSNFKISNNSEVNTISIGM